VLFLSSRERKEKQHNSKVNFEEFEKGIES